MSLHPTFSTPFFPYLILMHEKLNHGTDSAPLAFSLAAVLRFCTCYKDDT